MPVRLTVFRRIARYVSVYTSALILFFAPSAAQEILGKDLLFTSLPQQDAPEAPGAPSTWAPSNKDFIGTSRSEASRVYFTGVGGTPTEIFYPTADTIQNVEMEFIVMDAAKTWEAKDAEEKKQRVQQVTLADKRSLDWKTVTLANNGKWKITRHIFTDPNRNSFIQRVTFQTLERGKTIQDYNLYLFNNPAINNAGGGEHSGPGDNSRTMKAHGRTMLVAFKPNITASALAISIPWKELRGKAMVSSGFVGRNDGWTDLFGGREDRKMHWQFDGAYGGNVAQMGWIDFGNSLRTSISFYVVLSFGKDEREAMNVAHATLTGNLPGIEKTYTAQWNNYCQGLNNKNGKADDQYYLAAMTVKSSQDKSNGAIVAGLGEPWGESNGDSNRGGYHIVWARDLYKSASALFAAGDKESANRALDYLFNVQMQAADSDAPYSRKGRFPQNTFIDGSSWWNGTQMDETSMPIILAWKLNRTDLWPKIKLAADYLAANGPHTDQERWEEMGGYSPSTMAAEVSGLVCAAALADSAKDTESAKRYKQKADEWRNDIANWTFTTTGPYGNHQYYIRLNDLPASPDAGGTLALQNRSGSYDKRAIMDGGFLELVRMGVLSPNDWTILDTLPEYDQLLKQTIPGKGDAWFRYNYDGYGEDNNGGDYQDTGRGRLWPIFTAERGIYEIARSGKGSIGQPYLTALKNFSSPAGLIPEQVWNSSTTVAGWQMLTPAGTEPGTATRSMRPLTWAMAEYINLIAAMNTGRNDAPEPVRQRYSSDKPQTTLTFTVNAMTQWGQSVYLVGDDPLLGQWIPQSGIKMSPGTYPEWSVKISLPASTPYQYKYVIRMEGASPVLWESGTNRVLITPASGEARTQDTFQ